jgi:hypothetical protein
MPYVRCARCGLETFTVADELADEQIVGERLHGWRGRRGAVAW